MPIGVTFGRYAYIEIRDFYFASKNFYFNSDKLDSNMARYQVDNWSGAESYPIQFNMNSYKNNNEVSTSDIAYNITYKCSDNVICQIDKTEGMITAEKHTDVFTVTIIPNAIFVLFFIICFNASYDIKVFGFLDGSLKYLLKYGLNT